MKELLVSLLPVALPLLATALSTGTLWVAVHVGNYFREKGRTTRVYNALGTLSDLAFAVVQDIEANERAELLRVSGKDALSVEEGFKLKEIALSRLKAVLGEKGPQALRKAVGELLGGDLDVVLSGALERAVSKVAAAQAQPLQSSPR
jgi:hypothetical protein